MPDSADDAAIEKAARLLAAARLPVIAGLRADVAGVVAAVRLAERLGGAVDHAAAEPQLDMHAALSAIGLMIATPAVARRADTLLVVGGAAIRAVESLQAALAEDEPRSPARRPRFVALGSRDALAALAGADASALPCDDILATLAALRARANGRPLAAGAEAEEIESCVATLASASYGVAAWAPADLGALGTEMLAGLIKDLNRATRWSGLPLADDPTSVGATLALGWMTGFPPRTGFARGHPEHDGWRFDARRLVADGEADAILWLDAFGAPIPDWVGGVPAVVLAPPAGLTRSGAAVALPVGRPGVDHAGVVHDPRSGTLVEADAEAASGLPSAAALLTRIREALNSP
jgi:formylmethanofuran dehydrogenase subunit B